MKAKFLLSMDSGAFSMYTKTYYKQLESQRTDWWKSKEFKLFLHKYIKFLHEHGEKLPMYLVLDVVKHPEASWMVQKYMESCGLTPVPVFHGGSDLKYLKRLLDKYEYIAIGGVASRRDRMDYVAFYDSIFNLVTDSSGVPSVKFHGLAMTGVYATRWPWYSVDSITWRYQAAVGSLLLPRLDAKDKFDYSKRVHICVTKGRLENRHHFVRLGSMEREMIRRWTISVGGDLDVAIDGTVKAQYQERSYLNAVYYNRHMADYAKKLKKRCGFEGAKLMLGVSGRFTDPSTWPIIERYALSEHIVKPAHLLDSFFYTPFTNKVDNKARFWQFVQPPGDF